MSSALQLFLFLILVMLTVMAAVQKVPDVEMTALAVFYNLGRHMAVAR